MYKALFLTETFESFKSNWGAFATPQPHENGWVLPLGWEAELTSRDIIYTVIEIEPQTTLTI